MSYLLSRDSYLVFSVVIPDQHETIADQEKIIQILQKEINSSHKIKCEWIGE